MLYLSASLQRHIDTTLTTEALPVTLRRFIQRRRKPKAIYSDNGNNFQGAANELHDIYRMLQSTSKMAEVREFLATEGCDWKFVPPNVLNFGGLWEATVKSMKNNLRRKLGSHVTTYEELCTLITEIEACLNSRELCDFSDNPFNPTYLSLGYFLIGEPLIQLPAAELTDVKLNRISRWQIYQKSCNNSDSEGLPKTSSLCNSVNAG